MGYEQVDNSDRLQRFVHGALPDQDKADLEAELAENADLRAELALVRAVNTTLRDQGPPEGVRAQGWDRLAQSIDAEPSAVPANDNRRYSLLQVAGVAAAAVLAWQFVAAPILFDAQEPLFTTASVQGDGPTLRVAFETGADMSAITMLLRDAGGALVDGPSAIGLYTVGFPDSESRDAAQTLFDENPALLSVVSAP